MASWEEWVRENPDKTLDQAPPEVRRAAWEAAGAPDYAAPIVQNGQVVGYHSVMEEPYAVRSADNQSLPYTPSDWTRSFFANLGGSGGGGGSVANELSFSSPIRAANTENAMYQSPFNYPDISDIVNDPRRLFNPWTGEARYGWLASLFSGGINPFSNDPYSVWGRGLAEPIRLGYLYNQITRPDLRVDPGKLEDVLESYRGFLGGVGLGSIPAGPSALQSLVAAARAGAGETAASSYLGGMLATLRQNPELARDLISGILGGGGLLGPYSQAMENYVNELYLQYMMNNEGARSFLDYFLSKMG